MLLLHRTKHVLCRPEFLWLVSFCVGARETEIVEVYDVQEVTSKQFNVCLKDSRKNTSPGFILILFFGIDVFLNGLVDFVGLLHLHPV